MEPISAIVLSLALGAAAEAGKATVAEVVTWIMHTIDVPSAGPARLILSVVE